MEGDLRIPLSSIPDEGLDLELELEAPALGLEEGQWPPLLGARLTGRLEPAGSGQVVFRGRVVGTFLLECSLGLARFAHPIEEPFSVYFFPHPPEVPGDAGGEIELADRDLEVAYIEDDAVNLLGAVRDQLGLAIPIQPRCPAECLGEDPETCRRLKADESVDAEGAEDPRWSALKEWKK